MQNQDHVNEVGIEQSEIVAEILTTSVKAIIEIDTNQDGDVQFVEGLNAVQTIAFKAIKRLPNLTILKAEVKDYTEGEKDDLIDTLSEDTGITSAKLKALIIRAAAIVLDVIDLIIDAGRPEEDFETTSITEL